MRYFTNKWTWIPIILLCGWLNHALALTQPKFTIIPTTATSVVVPYYDFVNIQYVLTNQMPTTRKLAILFPSTSGFNFDTTISGACTNPVTLAYQQSCTINFNLVGSQLPATTISSSVKVCKTNSASDNGADPFLCSQTAQSNNLSITRNDIATISADPLVLFLNSTTGVTRSITITNHSTSITATNVSVDFSGTILNGNITQDASGCTSVAPGGSCTLYFTPGTQAVAFTRVPISGDNTNTLSVGFKIIKTDVAPISVTSGSPLDLESPNGTGSLTITNNSPNITATNVVANLTTSLLLADVTQNSTGCTSILPHGTCTLQFTAGSSADTVTPQLITIGGSNTSLTPAYISVTYNPITFSITPSSLTFSLGSTSTQSMTVLNTSDRDACNIAPELSGTALESTVQITNNTCADTCIAASASCTITYQLITPTQDVVVPTTSFPIFGVGTETVAGTITIGTHFAYVIAKPINGSSYISSCAVDTTTGSLSSCAVVLTTDNVYLSNPVQLAVDSSNNFLYISNLSLTVTEGFITRCDINVSDGTLSNCQKTQSSYTPSGIALNSDGTFLYIAGGYNGGSTGGNTIYYCDTSAFTSCSTSTVAASSLPTLTNLGATVNSGDTRAYFAGIGQTYLSVCSLNSNTSMTCSQSTSGLISASSYSVVIDSSATYLYVVDISATAGTTPIFKCTLSAGAVASCTSSGATMTSGYVAAGAALNVIGSYFYFTSSDNYTGIIRQCAVGSTGGLTCVDSGGSFSTELLGLALWQPPS